MADSSSDIEEEESSSESSEALEASPSPDFIRALVLPLAFGLAFSSSVAFPFFRVLFSLVDSLDEEDEESESSLNFLEAQDSLPKFPS